MLPKALMSTPVVLVLWVGSPAAAEHYYHYFDQKRPLELNYQRVAVFNKDASKGTPSSLNRALGVQADRVVVSAMPGWSTFGPEGQRRTATSLEGLVRLVAEKGVMDFVSPVFVGTDGGTIFVRPDLLVRFHANIDPERAEAILAEARIGEIVQRDWGGMRGAYQIRSRFNNGFDVLEAANALAERPETKFAEPNMVFTGQGGLIPNDTLFGDLWGIHNTGQSGGVADMDMDGVEAWDITTGDPGIIIAVLDTGVQQDHPDINQIPGADTTSEGPGDGGPVNLCDIHGTAVAGCVSARINNNLGVVGIAPTCKSASVRAFISTLACDLSWISGSQETVDALDWAQTNGARVTCNSNFYGFTSSAIDDKYADTRNAGMIHFACAGNDGSTTLVYPGSLPTTNAVTAITRTGALAGFATTGVGLTFVGPGVSIRTTDRTGADGFSGSDYALVSGCSFATPYASGVAALALSFDPSLDAPTLENLMQTTAMDLGPGGYDTSFGWGLVNANDLLLAIGACDDDTDCGDGEICTTDTCVSGQRSEERRVGKECRSRWSPYH